MKRTKAYSFTHRTKVFADSTVRKNGVWPRENWQGLRWHRSKWTYKRKRSGERRSVSSRTAEWCALSSVLFRRVKVPLALE